MYWHNPFHSLIRLALTLGTVLFLADNVRFAGAEEKIAPPQKKAAQRFLDRGEFVEDTQTHLLWQKNGKASGKMNFYQAKTYAKNLKLGGHQGWRVPTGKELAGIFPATGKPFTNTPYTKVQCCKGPFEWNSYWTSEVYTGYQDGAYVYHWYAKGGKNNCLGSRNRVYVRCVHDPIPVPLAEADKRRVPKLIEQLSDDSFIVRERAHNELKALGPSVHSLLRDAMKNTKDAEARSRLARLLGEGGK